MAFVLQADKRERRGMGKMQSRIPAAGSESGRGANEGFGSTTSAPESVTADFSAVVAPSFTLSSTTSAQTIEPGGSAGYTITATPQNGAFTNPITFSVSGLPTGATGTFQPGSITPGSTAATTQLTIQLAGTLPASFGARPGWPIAASMLSLLGLFFATRRRRTVSSSSRGWAGQVPSERVPLSSDSLSLKLGCLRPFR
jgi:hypothetical protein